MPSADLQSLLLERIENPDLWVTGQQDWSVPDVLGSMRTAKPFCKQAHGKRVALACSSNLSVVWALCLLDGVAESVLLVPSGLSQSTLSSFCEQVAFDFLVCEQEKPVPVGLESLELLILPPPVRNGDDSARETALTTANASWQL